MLENVATERISTLLLALLVAIVVGGPLSLWRKTGIIGFARLFPALIDRMESKLNRDRRSEGERRMRGLVVVFLVLFCAMYAGLWLERATPPFGILGLHVALIVLFIPMRLLFDHTLYVARALAADTAKPEAAKAMLGQAARRNPDTLDRHGVARAGIENLAENFADRVVSPAFWYILLGLPGLLMARAANSMDARLGSTAPQARAFGWAAARVDDIVQYLPSRIAGFLLCIAAFFAPLSYAASAFSTLLKDASRMVSPNSGWPIAAMAGALKLSLGGPRQHLGRVIEDGWVGSGTPKPTVRDMKRALILYALACSLLLLLLVLLLYGLRAGSVA